MSATVFTEIESDAAEHAAAAFLRLAVEYFEATRAGDGPVSTALAPEEIALRFDEPLPVEGRPLAAVIDRLRRDVVSDANRLSHPRAMGHQVSAPLPAAVWTESLTAALNQSGAVWEMSPVGTVLEARVVRWLCDLVGLGEEAGGVFTSGGTEATFVALLAARAAALPDAWSRGVGADPPVVLHGEHAHYAVSRAVGEIGIGTDSAIAIPSRGYRMEASRTSSASAGAAAASPTTTPSTRSTSACARSTTARARAGSPPLSSVAGASCGAP